MRRKRAQRKREKLQRLARCVSLFYPELRDVFLCPTCLRKVPIGKAEEISDAHIVPKAASGGLRTLLCRRCNSTFGLSQDKWFGEYLRLLDGQLGPLSASHQAGHFEVGGQRVNGRYGVCEDGHISVRVWADKNSPVALDALEKITARARLAGSLRIKFPIPTLANKEFVSCGFLTAAYLLWFRELGYSWALQDHLEIVREQIANPGSTILPANAIAASRDHTFQEPSIGTCRIADELVLFAALADRLVFLPPVDRPNLYESLPESFGGMKADDMKTLSFGWQDRSFPGPTMVVLGDRAIVAPDVVVRRAVNVPVIVFPKDGSNPRTLYPISEEEYVSQSKQPNVTRTRIDTNLRAPGRDTGR